ncbi:MAG: hypothetical protein J6Q53_04405 [Oscillospiraceae bacterium]|nr:hypothetical protein [Oscillospiraceae bacterium]
MGNFSNNAITDVGRMLLADVQAGAVFTPTRIVIGSGNMVGGATAQSMTAVITPVKSLAINKKQRTPDGKCIFGGVYTNEEVTAPFYFRELALYAKAVYLNTDGSVRSEGEETLYSYGNAGTTADYMPAYSTSTVVEKQIDLVTWVGNDAQVNLTIESGIFITHENFDNHAARHAADGEDPITPESIGAAPGGYGLGGMSQLLRNVDLNDITDNGWYSWRIDCINIPFDSGTMLVVNRGGEDSNAYSFQIAFYDGSYDTVIKVRKKTLGTWGEWRNWSTGDFAPDGFGLGGYPQKNLSLAELDSTFDTGWYMLKQPGTILSGVSLNYANVLVHCLEPSSCVQELRPLASNVVLRRICHQNNWAEWEVENPPMHVGVEYRTTEQYKGFAVYKKIDAIGNILWRAENETSWHLLSSADYVATATVE